MYLRHCERKHLWLLHHPSIPTTVFPSPEGSYIFHNLAPRERINTKTKPLYTLVQATSCMYIRIEHESLKRCSTNTSVSHEAGFTIHSISTFRGNASSPVSATLGNWRPDERHAISTSANENLKDLRRSEMTISGYKCHHASTAQAERNALSSSKANCQLNHLISYAGRILFHGNTYPLS